jgi:hypothetical protein
MLRFPNLCWPNQDCKIIVDPLSVKRSSNQVECALLQRRSGLYLICIEKFPIRTKKTISSSKVFVEKSLKLTLLGQSVAVSQLGARLLHPVGFAMTYF